MKLTARVSLTIGIYAVWILANANSKAIWGIDPKLYDYTYWFGERIFVISVFWTLILCVEKKYQWVIKVLLSVAVIKMVYLWLVVTKIIKPNDFQHIMALLVTVIISITALKWPKSQK